MHTNRTPSARLLSLLVLPAFLVLAAPLAHADTRVFVIDNSDGYGVDGCLSSGAPCGERIASAWCRSHDYARAVEFGRVEDGPLRRASADATAEGICPGPLCASAVAITCTR
ncbi:MULTISPECIES: hypothetical protein [unclassified Xanthobacter]|uniref:hypothetical protein n=1 Tax=unclassified Xanthobacter TaxID=2623496 RepID=UPI001EDD3F18|nr:MULTISPECIES: hypothetical protein [unclassified Xanthobacter]